MRDRDYKRRFWLLNKWLHLRNKGIYLKDHETLKDRTLAVYGIGDLGKRLIEELLMDGGEIVFAVDKNGDDMYADFDIYSSGAALPYADVLIVTPFEQFNDIKLCLDSAFEGKTISLENVVDDLWKREWERL